MGVASLDEDLERLTPSEVSVSLFISEGGIVSVESRLCRFLCQG